MNDEYGTYSKEDGEEVLSAIREENAFNENTDHNILFQKIKSYHYMIFLEKRNKTKLYYLKIILMT